MRLAILSGLAESSLAFLPLCSDIPSSQGRSELQSQAAAIVGVRRRTPELAAVLAWIGAKWAGNQAQDENGRKFMNCSAAINGLAEGLERSGAPLSALVAKPPLELKAGFKRIESFWPAAAARRHVRPTHPRTPRCARALRRGRPEIAETVIPAPLLPGQPLEIQLAAARAVALSRQTSTASKAFAQWSKLTVGTRRALQSGLNGDRTFAPALVQALEDALIAPGELDGPTRTMLEHLPDASHRQRAAKILAKSAPPERSAALLRYQAALKLSGDVGRGANVFAKNCLTCHQRQGQGHRVGPDLSGIAGRAPDALLADILDPNHEVAPDYVTLSVATRRGQVFAGLLAEETATTLKLRRADGIEDNLLRSEIDELRSTGKSLMPEGLEQNINFQEMADLISFLREGR